MTGKLFYNFRMADKRFKTFVKMLIVLTVIFIGSRAPMDIIQLSALIEAGQGYNRRDLMEIEYEIVLIWVTYLPLILNPVVYFSFLGEYRRGAQKVIRMMFGCQTMEDRKEEKMQKYKEEEILQSKDNVSRTQETNIL